MFISIILFVLGLVLLIKGGDWFVDGAVGVAHKFRIPELIIGATIVSIGTTLPEVMVSATSALQGHGEIAYGNAIGSIICNTSLIAALTAAIKPSGVDRKTFLTPVIFFWVSAFIYVFAAYKINYFSRFIGVILLALFFIYIFSVIFSNKKGRGDTSLEYSGETPLLKNIFLILVGAVLIAGGANLLVNNGIKIASGLGVPESVIALTFVALGTSLPELVTAITSLVKGHGTLSLGNIIGANFFYIFLVSGVSITMSPFALPSEKIINGINSSLLVDLPLMLFVMFILTVPALLKEKLSRWQGVLLLVVYSAFCTIQFII